MIKYTDSLARSWLDRLELYPRAGDPATRYWAEVALGKRRAGKRAHASSGKTAYRFAPPETRREAQRAVVEWEEWEQARVAARG